LVYDQLDSTNAEAARIGAGMTRPVWILAHEQTAARGRRGREWVQPAGNFSATLVMKPTEAPQVVALRSFVMAVALAETVERLRREYLDSKEAQVRLKWPNDVLLGGGKLAGILLESCSAGTGVSYLAIGVGVNLALAPGAGQVETRALAPVALAAFGPQVVPEAFLDVLAPIYAQWEARFLSEGFAPVRQAWLARAARLGEEIEARTGRETWRGTFETVDMEGALVLGTPNGPRAIPAADVYF
jgi:BirA family biotin operon repressor/biotin-[acetyl-CoA-carboxylase] ligase